MTPVCSVIPLLFALLIQPLTKANDTASGPGAFLPGVTLVDGQQVPYLQGQPVSTLRVYAFHGDEPIPIPFQIDERDRRDRLVLDHGAQQHRDDPAGVFDQNDVIVFMNRDLGHRGNFVTLPAGATIWAEIRVGQEADPLGFAYIGVFDASLPFQRDEHIYARYDPDRDRIYAERYALEFGAPLPTHLAFVGQLGEFGMNTVTGIHAAGEVRFLGGLFTLRRTEKNIQMELLGYRSGPVRVIRRARYRIPLPLGFRTTGRVDLLFYRDFVEGTALVKIKIPPRLVLADGELKTYFDFLDLSGARLLLEGEQPSDPIDGHMTPSKQALAGHLAHWAALLLPDGRTVLLIVRLEGALQHLEQRLYFEDANNGTAVGKRPIFGFAFSRVNRLETGAHRLSVFAMLLESTAVADIHRTVNFFLSSPEVSVSEIKRFGIIHGEPSLR